LELKIEGNRATALLDSGATGKFMNRAFVKRNDIRVRKKRQPYELGMLNSTSMKVEYETIPLKVQTGRHWEKMCFDITNHEEYDVVLGFPWLRRHNPTINWQEGTLQQFGCDCPLEPEAQTPGDSHREKGARSLATDLRMRATRSQKESPTSPKRSIEPPEKGDLTKNNTATEASPEAIEELIRQGLPVELKEFATIFQEREPSQMLVKHEPWDHEIPLKEGEQPKFMPLYRLTEDELKELRRYLDDNLAKGYIRPSTSPAGYPVIFVPKKDGTRRLCVDYRQLNAITVKNRYPLPLISEIQDRFQGCTWFTVLDQREAYYRIRIKEGDEWKTAFRTRYGLYEYLIMPFGLTNAPASQQALLNGILYEYLDDFVIVYLDDILIFSKGSKEDHIEKVKKVLRKLTPYDRLLKLKKCEFFKKEVAFLGHIVTTEGIRMDPEKIKAILEWPTPKTVTEVQAFHGLANYYRQFIPRFSDMAKPLTNLTKKDQEFQWTTKEKEAFEAIKEEFRTGDIRTHHDPERQNIVDTDASDCAIAARLQQLGDNGKPRLIACYARSLSPAEQNYDVHDKELLAIVEAFKRWRVELCGAKHQVLVLSDHYNLEYFTTTKKLNRRQARWSEELAEYDFRIRHCKGKENVWADTLSRRPDLMTKHREEKTLFKQENGDMVFDRQALKATRIVTSESPMWKRIRDETREDKQAVRLRKMRNTIESDGVITYHGLVYVPKNVREEIMKQAHDAPTSGHFGLEKMMERIMRTYYWPGMWVDVRKYLQKCDICGRSKASRHQAYGQLQPVPQLQRPWDSVAMDFIVKLPKSKDPTTGIEYDSILTVVERMTKYGYFIPFRESTDAPRTAHTVIRTVVANHGLPKEWITDRDPKFTGHFWKTMFGTLGVKSKASTAYHPQTDGQTERLNQTVEQFLRCYVNYEQDNWVALLPLAQMAYNGSKNATTGMTPHFANYGKEIEIERAPLAIQKRSQQGEISAKKLKDLHEKLRLDIEFTNARMKEHYDRRHQEAPPFREGEKVFLLRRNIKTKRPNEKLDHRKLGPFKIRKKLGKLSYELELPKTMRIHPIFHVSLLEKAPQNARQCRTETDATEMEYEVEKILGHSQIEGETRYLVKWKGYPTEENTWEPIEHLQNAQAALKDYRQSQETEKRTNRSKPRRSIRGVR
jgi:hypothetical protein